MTTNSRPSSSGSDATQMPSTSTIARNYSNGTQNLAYGSGDINFATDNGRQEINHHTTGGLPLATGSIHSLTVVIVNLSLNFSGRAQEPMDVKSKDKELSLDGQGWSPLHPAVKSGGKDVIWLPLSKGASGKIGSEGVPTLLELALTLDDTSVTLLLHEHGANIHATDELGMTILHKACNAGSLPHVESLLNMGSKIGARDVEGWTPLHHSVLLGQGDVVRLLVSRAQQAELDQQDSKHNTALMLATLLKNQGIMELLLGRGASYDVQDQNGITALHHAAKLGFNAGLRILVAKRGKINLADKRGYTALHHAVNSERADAETVKILCTAGANLGERQENGYSALKLAKELGRDDIASRLVRYKRTAREINPIRNNATHGQRSAR